MRRLLIGMAIDILKWTREPLFRLYQAIYRLRLRRSNLLVSLQFRYYELAKKVRKGTELAK